MWFIGQALDSYGIKKPVVNGPNMAGGLGFEPRLTESESAVLPLDDPPFVNETWAAVAPNFVLKLEAVAIVWSIVAVCELYVNRLSFFLQSWRL